MLSDVPNLKTITINLLILAMHFNFVFEFLLKLVCLI